MRARAHVIISGMVQGVCFRYETIRKANTCGVSGWVRNNYDNTVEAVFEGPEESVKDIVAWCHKGPEGAIVKDVIIKWETYTGDFNGFNIDI